MLPVFKLCPIRKTAIDNSKAGTLICVYVELLICDLFHFMPAKPLSQTDTYNKDVATCLAIERTAYALERTQLAWIRTTLAFLGSGIALDKGMQLIHEQRLQLGNALFESSHVLGVVLSMGGSVALLLTTWLAYKRFRKLAINDNGPLRFPAVLFSSLLIALLGIVISVLMILT